MPLVCLLFCPRENWRKRVDKKVEYLIDAMLLLNQEADYLASAWRFKTIGPTVPSFYLDDDRLQPNKTYGFNISDSTSPCLAWLDNQPPCSVVYASYGTVAYLDPTQLDELGNGFCNSGKPFLWVVRSCDEHKLSEELRDKCKERGLIVSWCPQLEVLSHKATGMEQKVMFY